jgi:hypothetical protein
MRGDIEKLRRENEDQTRSREAELSQWELSRKILDKKNTRAGRTLKALAEKLDNKERAIKENEQRLEIMEKTCKDTCVELARAEVHWLQTADNFYVTLEDAIVHAVVEAMRVHHVERMFEGMRCMTQALYSNSNHPSFHVQMSSSKFQHGKMNKAIAAKNEFLVTFPEYMTFIDRTVAQVSNDHNTWRYREDDVRKRIRIPFSSRMLPPHVFDTYLRE